jgi:hypothetical protein
VLHKNASGSFSFTTLFLETRIRQAGLVLVFAAAILVGDIAILVGFKKDDLPDSLVDIDAQRQIGQIA